MKTALLLSGQPRFLEKYYDCIYNNIIRPNNADVFFHCWEIEDISRPFRYGSGWANERINPNYKNFLLNKYKPKAYIFEYQKKFIDDDVDFTFSLKSGYAGGTENKDGAKYHTFATRSMWYSIMKCWELCSSDSYDCVIKHRFDAGISKTLKVENYDLNHLWAEDLGRSELVNNWCNFGNSEVMSKYCTIYNKIDSLYKETNIWCNEYWIKYVMDQNNIQIKHDYLGLTIESRKL